MSISSANGWQWPCNLSTALSSRGELYVDPKICNDSFNPIVYDSYSSTNSISVYSGTNGGYHNHRTYSAKILNRTNNSIDTSTHSYGVYENALTVLAAAYGGLGAAQDKSNAEAAQTLYNGSTNTGCRSAYLQTRITNSASARSL